MRLAAAVIVSIVIGRGVAVLAVPQPPAPQPPPPKAPGEIPPAPPAPAAPAETYTYQPEGRRDPFLSLVGSGSDMRGARKGDGLSSMHASDISVSGVLQSRGEMVAMIKGPDNKTYIVHQGDKLADGTIKSITPQGLVLLQEVNDPLSLVKQREIRKLLRSLEDGKE
jgi:type IV pilus assembly protein PilP